MTYSQAEAYARHRYSREHQHGYLYEFEPTGGYGAWVGPRPCIVNLHGGGFDQPDVDTLAARYPSREMGNSQATLNHWRDAGYTVLWMEYPLGFHPPGWSNQVPNSTDGARMVKVAARAFQYIKTQLAARIRPNEIVVFANSSGAWVVSMLTWTPASWSLFPHLPALGPVMDGNAARADARPAGIMLNGIPWNFCQMDPGRLRGSYAPITTVFEGPYRYHPRLKFTGTVSGTLAIGSRLRRATKATDWGIVQSISGGVVELLVYGGEALDFVLGDTLDEFDSLGAGTGDSLAVDTALEVLDVHGTLEVPLALKVAASPQHRVESNTSTGDLAAVRAIPVFVGQPENGSVGPSLVRDSFAVAPGLHGADDSAFGRDIEARLAALGIPSNVYWGIDPSANTEANAQITAISNANGVPRIVTLGAPAFHVTGDVVSIAGTGIVGIDYTSAHLGLTITRVSSTQFSLNTVLGNGGAAAGPGGRWAFTNPTAGKLFTSNLFQATARTWLEGQLGIVP